MKLCGIDRAGREDEERQEGKVGEGRGSGEVGAIGEEEWGRTGKRRGG